MTSNQTKRPSSACVPRDATIGVVGAGVIGVACAYELAGRGYRVTLIDQAEPGRLGASFANAGHIAASDIFPLGGPGIALTAVRMLANRDGPLKIPPAHVPMLTPWLWAFWRASQGEAHERSVEALTQLSAGAVDETERLFQRAGVSDKLRRIPALYLYESDRSYEASKEGWRRKEMAGRRSTQLDRAELTALEPALAPLFPRGVLSHEWAIVSDPYDVVRGLFDAACKLGVEFQRTRVGSVEGGKGRPRLRMEEHECQFDAVVIAAGVWSRTLAEGLGERLPLEAERGYNLTFPEHATSVARPMVFADRGVVATSLASGLRIGGWAELGGLRRPPHAAYFRRIRRIAETLLPCLQDATGIEWMGHRPSLPDSVPVLSRSRCHERVFFATGHGHYGLTHAARSARIIADLVSGESGDSRYTAYSLARFCATR